MNAQSEVEYEIKEFGWDMNWGWRPPGNKVNSRGVVCVSIVSIKNGSFYMTQQAAAYLSFFLLHVQNS